MRRLLLLTVGVAFLVAAPAFAHKGSPNYLSVIEQLSPSTPGLTFTMANRDDSLILENRSGKDVTVGGYNGEQYARVLADGTVEVNTMSPAYYLNEERFGTVSAPDGVDGKDPPKWKALSKTGRFEWHDHRSHYMGKGIPKQVKDQGVKTKVFPWEVPLEVDGTKGKVAGTLFWTPLPGGGTPTGAIIVGAAIVIGLSVMVMVVRRRRSAGETGSGEGAEAW